MSRCRQKMKYCFFFSYTLESYGNPIFYLYEVNIQIPDSLISSNFTYKIMFWGFLDPKNVNFGRKYQCQCFCSDFKELWENRLFWPLRPTERPSEGPIGAYTRFAARSEVIYTSKSMFFAFLELKNVNFRKK